MSTNLAQLEMRLGVDWHHLRTARELAASKRLELRQALEHLDSEDTSIVVSGSHTGSKGAAEVVSRRSIRLDGPDEKSGQPGG